MNSTLDLETVLSTIVAKAVQLSGTEAGAIYVFDDRQRELHLRATYGMDQELIGTLARQHIGLDEANVALALAQHEPVQIADLNEAAPSAVNEIILRAGYRALLVAPLLRGEDIVGILVVRRRTPGQFARNTVDLVKTFAAQSAVAIENARLFQNIEASLQDLRTAQDRLVQTEKLASLGQLTAESLNLAYHGARAEKQGFNITLERSFDPAAGEVDLFPQEITRALLNLISNGFYAATKRRAEANGGNYEPTLAAATKNLGDSVEIRIRDNGTGIPPEVREKLFNPFFTTKPAGEGTGLGLSISHDIIVKQHGGSIEVDTQPGEFTEFRIVLPRAGASLIKSGRTHVNPLVLVVDDEPDVEVLFRQQFRRDLRAGRFTMEFAQSAPMALQRIADAAGVSLILVLSDINMPGMSGLDLLPKAKALRPDVPVIMITAYGDAETKRQALENGAEALLTKPIDFGTLRSEIDMRVERAA